MMMAECVLRPSLGGVSCLKLSSDSGQSLVGRSVGPSFISCRVLQLAGSWLYYHILCCPALAHWVYLLTCSAICGSRCFISATVSLMQYANSGEMHVHRVHQGTHPLYFHRLSYSALCFPVYSNSYLSHVHRLPGASESARLKQPVT